MKPLFLGLSGTSLTADERALFRDAEPAGFILFARNIEDPEQVRKLTFSLREITARERLPILIDQEGGRVSRLGPPHWPEFPSGRRLGEAFAIAPVTAIEVARLNAEALGAMLTDLGISVNCLPVLDIPAPGAHDVIGDRAYGTGPAVVAALGDATVRGMRAGGIVPVIKHIPGHGRAKVDSHAEHAVVDASRDELETDFAPFRALAAAPMAMTAHVTYTAIDADHCASQSPIIVDLIRCDIGFGGLLMSDDLCMAALPGPLGQRLSGVLAAGCDAALHCSGDFAEAAALCDAAPEMGEAARARLADAMAWPADARAMPITELVAARDRLLQATG